MRDLINLIQILSEAPTLAPNEFGGNLPRWETFIRKIKMGEPFTTVDGDEVILDPSEADRFLALWQANNFIGNKAAEKAKLASPYKDSDVIRLSKLRKTTEFGGATAAAGQPATSGGKASYALTPQGIGIVDKDIPAYELYEIIKNNPVLRSTDHGKLVISLADYIVSGESVSIPPDVEKNKYMLAAIQDNAGEYLGVLALLYRRSRFPARKGFEEWLGTSTDDLVLRFPSAANFALADSFGMLKNVKTGHTVNISSKGKDGGAAPAISGLKIPKHIETNPKLKNAVEFVKICKTKGTIDQAFDGMDILYKSNPKSIDEVWHQMLPFSSNGNIKQKILDSLAGKNVKFGASLNPIISSVSSKDATPGGKIVYAIKREVAAAINDRDALPEFKEMVLELLEMNFVQQYMDYGKKNKYEFTFETQWPAKLDGKVSLENKSSAKEPTAGGFSFKLGRTDSDVSSDPDEPRVDGIDDSDYEDHEEERRTSVSKVFKKAKGGEPAPEPKASKGAGRERRRG